MSFKWVSDTQAYKRKQKQSLQSTPTEQHPLAALLVASAKQKITDPLEGLDPLSRAEIDPLTQMASELGGGGEADFPEMNSNMEPWSYKKQAILGKFTTQEKMTLTTSMFSPDQVHGVSEKVLHRLEQLDADSGTKQTFGGLSQEEYVNKINQLDHQLTQAWQQDLRVNALKISIQCCKLLGDSSVISFYPSKFVIITDILDKFGEMVYNRLKSKSSDQQSAEVAKETCKNWFFKVGSIRELLPRMSLELAILKSYIFITPQPEYARILSRMLNCMWGIGDPVVAIYMRCYLCRKAMELVPENKELYFQSFQDLILLNDQALDNFRHNPLLADAKVSIETYMTVLSPAVEWILQCLVHRGENLTYVMQLVSNLPSFWKSLFVSSVLCTFPPRFIGDNCIQVLEMIATLETNVPTTLKNLGLCLIVADPPHSVAKEVWAKVWPSIKVIQDRVQYLSCSQVWIEFVVKHFGPDIINDVLTDIMENVRYKDVDQFQSYLTAIADRLLTYCSDITNLLLMDKFVKLITMLKVDSVKKVVSTYNSKHSEVQTNNLVVNTLLHLTTILHDSIDALTPVDEVKQIGGLINGFLTRISYGKDFEKQLQFYDEARGVFSNIDTVLIQLIQCVCSLCMKVQSLVGGHHTKRTRAFVSACIAYAFITIPSLENSFTQLQLYLLTSQVAHSNHCVSQGEACLEAIIHILDENKVGGFDCSKPVLLEFVSNLLSTLLAVPDHVGEIKINLVKSLIDFGAENPWLNINILSLLGAYAQEKYAYHFIGVDANDGLYGGDPEFVQDLCQTSTLVVNNVLQHPPSSNSRNDMNQQGLLYLHLLNVAFTWADMTSPEMSSLAIKLWSCCRKTVDHKLAVRTLEAIRRKLRSNPEYQNLVAQITMD